MTKIKKLQDFELKPIIFFQTRLNLTLLISMSAGLQTVNNKNKASYLWCKCSLYTLQYHPTWELGWFFTVLHSKWNGVLDCWSFIYVYVKERLHEKNLLRPASSLKTNWKLWAFFCNLTKRNNQYQIIFVADL